MRQEASPDNWMALGVVAMGLCWLWLRLALISRLYEG
jgi:hypothetical protein